MLCALASKLFGKIAATVKAVRLRKIFVRLFAIEKHQFKFSGKARMLLKHAG